MDSSPIDNREKFKLLYFNFIDINHINKEIQHFTVNSLLDEFNSLNYKTLVIQDHTYGSQIISTIIKKVSPEDSFLAAKASRLIVNLVSKQKIPLFKEDIVTCVEWFLLALKTCSDIVLCDILEGLSSILKGNAALITKYHKNLMEDNGVLSNILRTTKKCDNTLNCPSDITLYTLKCLESLVSTNEDIVIKNSDESWISSAHLDYCGNIFLKYLYQSKSDNQDEINYCQILISSFNACRYLVQHPNKWGCTKIGELLGAIKVHIFHGLTKDEILIPQKVMPSQQPMPEVTNDISRIGRGGKMTRTRKQKTNRKISGGAGDANTTKEDLASAIPADSSFLSTVNNFTWIATSESDMSDSESSSTFRISQNQIRVRQKALELLLAMIRTGSKHELFGYWHSLMPSCLNDSTRSLSTCILHDPSPRCRIGALTILTAMLSGSRYYLWRADKSAKTVTAFTPFSVVLGSIISALHNDLAVAITQEQSYPVIIQILKCNTALIQATPYHRLEDGLLINLVCSIKHFVKHKDIAVQKAALIALGCAVSVQPASPEFSEIISKPFETGKEKCDFTIDSFNKSFTLQESSTASAPTRFMKKNKNMEEVNNLSFEEEFDEENFSELNLNDDNYDNSSPKISWLLQIALENLGITKEPAPVIIQIESLHVLTAIGSSYFFLFEGHLESLSTAIKSAFIDKHVEKQTAAGRSLDVIGYAMNSYLNAEDTCKKITSHQCYVFWESLLNPLMSLMQDSENPSLRSIACDCLGNIGNEVFKHFSRDRQIFVITNLFGCARDSDSFVRAAAVRALAVSVEFHTLRQDFGFIMDTADVVINLLKEPFSQIRIKAYWSLGNLSDAFVYSVMEQKEEVSETMLKTLIQYSIDGMKDNDRVKFNAMRAVGCFLRILSPELIQKPDWKTLITESIKRLTNPTGTMKVFWNACYALGNVLKNEYLFQTSEGIEWQRLIYTALNGFVVKSPNFKVRINAAVSLAVPEKRQHYGSFYLSTWSSLILALDCSNNMVDFNEYKHRDNLVDQICISLAHLIKLATTNDLCNLYDIASPNLDVIRIDMSRVTGRLVPEKSSSILNACTHIQMLKMKSKMTSEQKNAVFALCSVFTE